MCECGCSMGNPIYRLPLDSSSCYIIELYPGCKNCSTPPGVIVRKVDSGSDFWVEFERAPVFPLCKYEYSEEGCIKCGMDPDEFRKAAAKLMEGTHVEDRKIDRFLGEVLAEDIWESFVQKMPEVVKPQCSED